MKVGCAVWNFTQPHYEGPYEDAIRTVAKLGFEGLELICFTPADLDEYYTAAKIRELKKLYTGYGMELTEFVLYAHLVHGLASTNKQRQQEALDIFERGLDIAASLGTDTLNIVSNWPLGLEAPINYPPAYLHPYTPGIGRFEPTFQMTLPEHFDWAEIWDNYMESLAACVELAEKVNMKFALEGHAHVIVSSTDAFLRAFDRIPSRNFGTNFDTAWQFAQREYVPWSIYKLKDRIFHVHVRDGDSAACFNLPPGRGVIDWHGVVRALKEVGYDGYLSIELGGYKNPEYYVRESKLFLERIIEEVENELEGVTA